MKQVNALPARSDDLFLRVERACAEIGDIVERSRALIDESHNLMSTIRANQAQRELPLILLRFG